MYLTIVEKHRITQIARGYSVPLKIRQARIGLFFRRNNELINHSSIESAIVRAPRVSHHGDNLFRAKGKRRCINMH